MNKTRWVVASIGAAIVITALEFVFHGILLTDLYKATAAVWRPMPEMSKLMPLGWGSTLMISFILVYIYDRGYQGKGSGLAEGLRFGFVIGLLQAIPMTVWTYIMYPLPLNLCVYWFLIAMADMLVAGVLIGLIYKKKGAMNGTR